MTVNLKHIAELVSGEIIGDPATVVSGVSSITEAGPGDLVFAESKRHLTAAENSAAAAVLSSQKPSRATKPVVVVTNPRTAFTTVLGLFSPASRIAPGVDRTAYVGEGARIGKGASVGFCAFIGEGSVVEDGATILGFAYVGPGVTVGEGSIIYPHVTLNPGCVLGKRVIIHSGTVIGADGFGYNATAGGIHEKVPHIGGVLIEDDVEIGANSTVDRARTGSTIIGSGTKIDNLVHVAHNVKIGRNCIVVAQVGISGSVVVGDNVVLAGQVGVKEHVNIGSGTQVGAKSGIISDIQPGSKIAGFPARPYHDEMRIWANLGRLHELAKRVKELEDQVSKLQGGSADKPEAEGS